MHKLFAVICLLSASFFVFPEALAAAAIRVPQDRSSIQEAINATANGDTILVSPGTYTGSVNLNKGVTLQATSYDSANPKKNQTIIEGDLSLRGAITIPSGVNPQPRIVGFWIRNSSSDPYYSGTFSNSPYIIESSYLTSAGDLSEYEKGSGGLARNNVYEGAGDDGIDLDNQVANIIIEGNHFLNSRQDGIEMRFQDDKITNTVDVIIRNNKFEANGQSSNGGDGIQFIDYGTDTNRRITIERNLFLNNKSSGIGLMCCQNTIENFEAASVREEIRVINNTFVGNNYGLTGGDNLLALNNIFVNTTNLAVKNVDNKSKVSYNLFYANGANFSGSNVDGTTTLLLDPKLTADYSLSAGSPAIDQGSSTFSWQNIFGQNVNINISSFQGSSPDLGWSEGGLIGPTIPPQPASNPSPTQPFSTPPPAVEPTLPSIATGKFYVCW